MICCFVIAICNANPAIDSAPGNLGIQLSSSSWSIHNYIELVENNMLTCLTFTLPVSCPCSKLVKKALDMGNRVGNASVCQPRRSRVQSSCTCQSITTISWLNKKLTKTLESHFDIRPDVVQFASRRSVSKSWSHESAVV